MALALATVSETLKQEKENRQKADFSCNWMYSVHLSFSRFYLMMIALFFGVTLAFMFMGVLVRSGKSVTQNKIASKMIPIKGGVKINNFQFTPN